MKKLSVAFLTLVLVSACGGGSGGSSSGGAGGGNSAPLITSGNTFSVTEGNTSIGTVSATDSDGDSLTFSLSGDDAGVVSIGSTSGVLTFNAAPDFESPADANGDNVYNVTARVGDGSAFDARDLVITVVNDNDGPVISSSGSYTVTENVTVIGSVDATDADGDTLTYSLTGDDANLMTVSSAGALAFVAAPDYESPADAGADNVYNATVTVSDGTSDASQALTVTVTDLEEAVPAGEIFISEYAEGSSNNKYLEIANNTGASVSLDGYALPSVSNDPATVGEYEFWNGDIWDAGSTIADNDVFVVCHGSASDAIAANCDATHNFLSNGDDGYKLVKGTEESFTVIDVVGDFQGDPGSGWEVCGVANGTQNHTLVKKEGVEGNTDWTASRGTSAEDCDWIVKDIDDNADLGQHCWDSTFAAESVVINNTSGVVSVAENSTAVATVSATASACGSVAYSLAGTDSALFTVSSAGVVEFAAAPDYETPGDANSDNVYEFNAVATNGSATDSLAMVVTVTDVDEDIPTFSGQVYISEYAEGTSNNKYLEIFNGTSGTINLDDYAMANASNGADTAGAYDYWNPFTAGATLGKGQVWVVCHPSADDVIKAECDQEFTYLSNGDDGFAIVQGTEASYTVLDRVGDWGAEDPGDGWAVCGVADATKDNTLVKKSDKYGTDDWSVSAGTNADDCYWTVAGLEVWDGVGSHTETEAADPNAAAFTEAFGGATVDGTTFTFPTGAEGWAGFANMNTALYPLSMPNGGTITFTAAVPDGGNAEVYFRFEKNPYPDTEPSVNSANVTITGAEEATYTVDIAAQGENTFSSFLLYVVTRDVPVVVKNVVVTQTAAEPAGVLMDMSGTFGNVGYNAETNGFTFPSSAEVWGGWAHNADAGTDMYPFTFTEAGKVKFKASAPNGDVVVKFKFERLPYPDTTPEFFTETVTLTGADEASYEVAVPAQGDNTFSSFLMYFETRDVEAYITDVRVVADTADDSGGDDSGGDDSGGASGSGGGTMSMIEAFGGATIDTTGVNVADGDNSVTGFVYEKPSGAESWAGFAHDPNADNSAIYPISMPNGGTITAKMAAYFESDPVNVYFKFEKDAYPNTTPDYQTANIELKRVSQMDSVVFTIDIPSQGENTFKNFLMYIVETDARVIIESVVVTPTQ